MSEGDITASGGSTIHGILVIVAAIIGVLGYIIRSRLNTLELKKQELQKQEEERRKEIRIQEEERRRAALAHCKNQLEVFIGPMVSLMEANSNYLRHVLYLGFQHEFAEALKSFRAKEHNTYFVMVGETTLNRLKNNDEEAIEFLIGYRLTYEKFNIPTVELLKKYQHSLCEMPTQNEHDEMYPGLKGKKQLTIFSMSIAACTHANYLLQTWDGKTNLFKNLALPKDAKHPLLSSPYFTLLARWQYDKILAKYEFLFKEDMQRANESIVEQNKKHHESFVSQNYKVDVGNSKSFSKS